MYFIFSLLAVCSANVVSQLATTVSYDMRKMKQIALVQEEKEAEKANLKRRQYALVQEEKKQAPPAAAAPPPPAATTAHPADAVAPKIEDLPVDEEGYKKDWRTEHSNDEYPDRSIDKFHHPDMSDKYYPTQAASTLGVMSLLVLLI